VSVRARSLASLWLPPIALMGLIFFLSAQANLSSGLGVIDLIARKLVHAGEYALLCVLWWRALSTVAPARTSLGTAVALTIAYAVTDELHQVVVPTRHGSVLDVSIDAAGALLAALVLWRRRFADNGSGARAPSLAAPP
jgi:VanZ family protein